MQYEDAHKSVATSSERRHGLKNLLDLAMNTCPESDGRVTSSSAARIGQLVGDVVGASNDQVGANFRSNRDFGGIEVFTSSKTLAYYFKPDQIESSDNNDEQTLELLTEIIGTAPVTANSRTITLQNRKPKLDL